MQSQKTTLPPSRPVLILIPQSLVEVLNYAVNVLNMSRSDVGRRSLARDVQGLLREEVARTRSFQQSWSGSS